MAATRHGHHIPNTPPSVHTDPKRCGGIAHCKHCKIDAAEYVQIVGEDVDYTNKAKQMVREYVDSCHRQNHPGTDLPVYAVYVESFTKTLQNWKARLGTTMPDGLMFELTYNGDGMVTYFDVYKKVDNFPVHDHPGALSFDFRPREK